MESYSSNANRTEAPAAQRAHLVSDASVEDVFPGSVGKGVLIRLIRALGGGPRVILLNACFSMSQARALAECVDCAIGMSEAIGDRASIVFAGAFYRAIGYGRSVQAAFDLGVNAMQLLGILEDATPRLFTRDGCEASKIVLIPS